MPRLGNDPAVAPGDDQPIANAYDASPSRQLSLRTILLMLFGAFTLRNILFHDYRSEEVHLLKASGKTEDQIDAEFVPRTASERRKQLVEDAKERAEAWEQMKKDIDSLKEEVKLLRSAVGEETVERIRKETSADRDEATS